MSECYDAEEYHVSSSDSSDEEEEEEEGEEGDADASSDVSDDAEDNTVVPACKYDVKSPDGVFALQFVLALKLTHHFRVHSSMRDSGIVEV